MQEQLKLIGKQAEDFSKRIANFKEVIEVGITGSFAGNSKNPLDLDLFVVVNNLDNLDKIAKSARRIQYITWEVFVFNKNMENLGRVSHNNNPNKTSLEMKENARFLEQFKEFNKKTFLESQVIILYGKEKIFEGARKSNNVLTVKNYDSEADITLNCVICAKDFTFSIGEQKWYEKKELSQPKKCERCRHDMFLENI